MFIFEVSVTANVRNPRIITWGFDSDCYWCKTIESAVLTLLCRCAITVRPLPPDGIDFARSGPWTLDLGVDSLSRYEDRDILRAVEGRMSWVCYHADNGKPIEGDDIRYNWVVDLVAKSRQAIDEALRKHSKAIAWMNWSDFGKQQKFERSSLTVNYDANGGTFSVVKTNLDRTECPAAVDL